MEEFKQYLKVRKNLYTLLSYAFYMEADFAYLKDIEKNLAVFKTIESNNVKDGIDDIKNFLLNGIDSKMIDELACAFARIFLVMNLKAGLDGVSPQESVYLSANHSIMQDERDNVLKIYYEQGLGKNDEAFKEPEDHISAELFFLAQMGMKLYDFIEADDEMATIDNILVQSNFMKDHLIKWVDSACDDIIRLADNGFYKGIAKVTKGFVHIDYDMLQNIATVKVS